MTVEQPLTAPAAVLDRAAADRAAGLEFGRTIDRSLVHRAALEEVFVTDFRSLAPDRFRAGGRLPLAHPYYTDDVALSRRYDALAVFECVRQTLLCALHLHHRVADEAKAVTASTGLRVADPAALEARPGGHELELDGSVLVEKQRDGALGRVVHRVEVRSAGRLVGDVTVDTAVLNAAAYGQLRMKERDTVAPSSAALAERQEPSALPAALFGRQNPDNVLLRSVRVDGCAAQAGMRLPLSHSSLFDHPQDHLPGTALLEAARQLALLLAGEVFGRWPARTVLLALDARYHRFAELDQPLTIEARYVEAGPRSFTEPIAVVFRQSGRDVAEVTLRLTGAEPGAASALPQPARGSRADDGRERS
ncbi:hypothetical protein KGA66_15075 [Actinocrinis puniceicyclus]|uniref:A-factor biosynthesis hotdog domain-containing protein n=1 Tax=Actinocrinis puniceicyclus TaxID=977794 RepID=A0A8J7WL67_9ACTN|nr:AfsA-related hotdog domain-containing protein [Actinocrinis puniceicyclus]MBS2964378.1 hypothetical protein [Actinocrinis puniceicyclus]